MNWTTISAMKIIGTVMAKAGTRLDGRVLSIWGTLRFIRKKVVDRRTNATAT